MIVNDSESWSTCWSILNPSGSHSCCQLAMFHTSWGPLWSWLPCWVSCDRNWPSRTPVTKKSNGGRQIPKNNADGFNLTYYITSRKVIQIVYTVIHSCIILHTCIVCLFSFSAQCNMQKDPHLARICVGAARLVCLHQWSLGMVCYWVYHLIFLHSHGKSPINGGFKWENPL